MSDQEPSRQMPQQQGRQQPTPIPDPSPFASMPPPGPFQHFEYQAYAQPVAPDLPPPPLPTAGLFTQSEHTNLLGFLDNFEWGFDPFLPSELPTFNSQPLPTAASEPPTSTNASSARPSAPHSTSSGISTPSHTGPSRPSPSRSRGSAPYPQAAAPQDAHSSRPFYPPPYPSAPQSHSTHHTPQSQIPSHSLLPLSHPDSLNALDSIGLGGYSGAHSHSHPHGTPSISSNNNTNNPANTELNLARSGGDPNYSRASQQQQQPKIEPGVHLSIDDGSIPILIGGDDEKSGAGGGLVPGGGNLAGGRPQKPVLTTPEKRVRHILSEQRRRNTIRDGYTQLQTMVAAHPSAPQRAAPSRGRNARPKGARGRTKGKGKSGVLFRAVEYIRWLEENVEDLTAEMLKLEAATQGRGGPWHSQHASR
ncbi:hypothetical protein DL93DRAFT_2070630 [Clavulina sp. PMI_390]|nr:hypothetical protein DL93DRAFT_2070630 [Clavulina sp. PMI_390]